MNDAQEPTISNAFRLTGRQWMGVSLFAVALYVLTPVGWQRAEKLETDALLIVTTRANAGPSVDQLLKEIERGDPISALKRDPNAPKIVTRRGYEIL